MSMRSANNFSLTPLNANRIYIGKYDNVLQYATAVITVSTDTETELTVYQSINQLRTVQQVFTTPASTPTTYYVQITAPLLYCTLYNGTGYIQTFLNFDVIYRQIQVMGPDPSSTNVNISDSAGLPIYATAGLLQVAVPGSVAVSNIVPLPSANIRTPSQLIVNDWYKVESLGNTPGAVWAEMGAIIGSESFPPIGRVFKCLEARYGTGTVSTVVYSQNTTVSNFPATQAVSGTVAVSNTGFDVNNFPATQAVSGTVAVSNTGFDVNNFPATQAVSGTVAVSNTGFDSNITNTFLTVKAKPTYSISIDSAGNTSQPIRSSAGVLHTVIITSLNTSLPMPSSCDYVKIYNASSATSADAPLATLPVRYGETIIFQADMNFSAGLCVRANSAYSVSSVSDPISTIYLTCFLTGYSE